MIYLIERKNGDIEMTHSVRRATLAKEAGLDVRGITLEDAVDVLLPEAVPFEL